MYGNIIIPFSYHWWQINLTILFCVTFLLYLTSFFSNSFRIRWYKALGTFLFFDLFFFEFALIYMGSWDLSWALPLQYCTIVEVLTAFLLITRSQLLYELVLFLGMIGPLQALIAPAFPYEGNYFFYEFYIAHLFPICTPIFFTLFDKMRPRKGAWWKSVAQFSVFAFIMLIFNYLTGFNYMFLMEKPPIDHPLVKIGEWPFYLVIWALILISWSFLIHLIFWVKQKAYTEHLRQ